MNRGQKKRILTNNTFFSSVVESTSRYLGGRVLLPNERNELSKYIRQIDLGKINNRKLAVDKVARGFAARVIRSHRSVDTHEILKKQINTISSDEKTEYNMDCGPVYPTDNRTRYGRMSYQSGNQNVGQNNNTNNDMTRVLSMLETLTTRSPVERPMRLENKAVPFNSILHKYPNIAKQKIQTMYLLLDSKYRNLSIDDSTFKWTLTRSHNTTQGSVNTLVDQIHNVISVQFEEFHVPTYTDTNIYEKVSLFVEEFGSTSVLLNNGGKYHMMFDVVQDGTLRKALIPAIYNDGEFKFHTPINNLNTITITFRSPFYPMTFNPDRYTATITYGSVTTFGGLPTGHGIIISERIYISGFSSKEERDEKDEYGNDIKVYYDTDHKYVNEMNRLQSYKVSGSSSNNISIPLDTSTWAASMVGDVINKTVTVFVESRRIFIPMRLQYIVE